MINLSALKMAILNPGHSRLKRELCLCLMEGETMCTLTFRTDLTKLPSPEQVLTNHYLNLYTRGLFFLFSPASQKTRDPTPRCFSLHSSCTRAEHCATYIAFLLKECQKSGEPPRLLVGKVEVCCNGTLN